MKRIILLIYSFILVFLLSLGSLYDAEIDLNINTTARLSNDNIVYVNDFDQVPETSGTIAQGSDLAKVGTVLFSPAGDDKYIININHPNGTTYILGNNEGANPIEIPRPENYRSVLISSSGRYYTDTNGDRMIWYEFQNPTSKNEIDKSIFDMTEQEITFYGFRPWVSWNVTDNTVDKTEMLQLYGVHHAGKSRQSYVDIVFPMAIDKLLMIEMSWTYAYQKVGGLFGYTEDRYDYQVRYADTTYHATNGWNEFKKFATSKWWHFWVPRNVDGIQELSVDNNYKSKYVSTLNTKRLAQNQEPVSASTLFGGEYSVQRVYMNTYSAGYWTGYRINDDLALVDLQYVYQGEYYHPVIDDVEFDFSGGQDTPIELPDLPNFITKILDPDNGYQWIFYVILGLAGIYLVLWVFKKFRNVLK